MKINVRGFTLLCLLAAPGNYLLGMELAGVKVAETKVVDGQTLKLNGAGIRTATMLKVKVYVAALYSPVPILTVEEAYASKGPLRFDFTFLRSFSKVKVDEAWHYTFEQSPSHTYAGLPVDQKAFSDSFGEIKKFGVETVEFVGDETRTYDDGVLRTTIKGRDFQKTFLGFWFGPKPIMEELKTELLAKK